LSKVGLAEMRKFCDETTKRPVTGNKEKGSTFRNAPAWVVRRIYELRQNLPLTPLPAEAYRNVKHGSLISEEERLRLQAKAQLAMQK